MAGKMAALRDGLIDMMYPVYGFRVNDDKEDTPCQELKQRDLTAAFAGQMSAHGPPHIYGARGIIKKTTWILVTVTACVWMVIQLEDMFSTFFSYGVTVSVDIRTARQVEFPSITVCNLNSIRNSYLPNEFKDKLTKIDEFEAERDQQRAEEELERQRLENIQNEPDPNEPGEGPPDPSDEYGYEFQEGPDQERPETEDDFLDNYNYGEEEYLEPPNQEFIYGDTGDVDPYADPDAVPDYTGGGEEDPDAPDDPPPVNRKKRFVTKVTPGRDYKITSPKLIKHQDEQQRKKRQITEEGPEYTDPGEQYGDNGPQYPESDYPSEDEGEPPLEPDDAMAQFDTGGDEPEEEEEETLVFYDPYAEENEESGAVGTDKDAADIKKESIFESLTDYPEKTKASWGHQKEDLIVECTYDGYTCNNESFTAYYNWRYGNCYAFNTRDLSSNDSLPSFRTGPLYGLKMVFNIEQHEYVADLTEKAGVRVLIHALGEMPFPEDRGLDIAPGRETSVGITQLIVSRQGGKYGDCVDTTKDRNETRNVYEEAYRWTNYSIQACTKTCYQRNVIQECGCFDSKYPSQGKALQSNSDTALHACSAFDQVEAVCQKAAQDKYQRGELSCAECFLPCNETSFSTTISQAAWPSLAYRATLLQKYSEMSDSLKALLNKGGTTLEDNFARLSIYFEELNLEEIIESPAMTLATFVSGIGGTLGLWIGVSVLSLFEFFEFFVDQTLLVCMRSCGWSSDKPGMRGRASSPTSSVVRPLTSDEFGRHPEKPPLAGSTVTVSHAPTPSTFDV